MVSDIPAGDGKLVNLFLQCSSHLFCFGGGGGGLLPNKIMWASSNIFSLQYRSGPREFVLLFLAAEWVFLTVIASDRPATHISLFR